jgi:acyl carrier protein
VTNALAARLSGLSHTELLAAVEATLRDEIAAVLGLGPAAPLDVRQGFFDLGMDSLTSVELRNRLQRAFAIALPPTLTFDYPTPRKLADHIARERLGAKADPGGRETGRAPVPPAREPGAPSPPFASSGTSPDLSGEDVAALLAAELRTLEERHHGG